MGALTEGVEHPLPPTASSGKLARHFQDKKQHEFSTLRVHMDRDGGRKKNGVLGKEKRKKHVKHIRSTLPSKAEGGHHHWRLV